VAAVGAAAIAPLPARRDRLEPRLRRFLIVGVPLLLGILIVLPIVMLIANSFNVAGAGRPAAFGLKNWTAAFSDQATVSALLNSLALALVRTGISMPVGIAMTWLVARTDMPGRSSIELLSWLSIFTPILPLTLGWILLLDPRFGMINAGLATAREWEDQTIKELLLAPISRGSLIAGKLLAGWLTTLLIGAIVLAIGALTGYLRPVGIYWLLTLLMVLLIALASASLGVALGAATRSFQRVTALGIPLAFYLFFLSGGISVAAFLPNWVQTIAHVIPTFYGVHALQMAIFYSSADGYGRDAVVMAGTALVTLALGVLSLRRRTLA
jgi:ABC-type multidrug transport system permease subunit